MNQQKFDDNGMTKNEPVRFVYKDVETGGNKSEDVLYGDASDIIEGKIAGDKMVNLPKAGWIQSFDIKKFYSVPTITVKKRAYSDNDFVVPIMERSHEDIKRFLAVEINRLQEKSKITGLPDPRLRVFPRLLGMRDRAQLVKEWGRFNSGEQ